MQVKILTKDEAITLLETAAREECEPEKTVGSLLGTEMVEQAYLRNAEGLFWDYHALSAMLKEYGISPENTCKEALKKLTDFND